MAELKSKGEFNRAVLVSPKLVVCELTHIPALQPWQTEGHTGSLGRAEGTLLQD